MTVTEANPQSVTRPAKEDAGQKITSDNRMWAKALPTTPDIILNLLKRSVRRADDGY